MTVAPWFRSPCSSADLQPQQRSLRHDRCTCSACRRRCMLMYTGHSRRAHSPRPGTAGEEATASPTPGQHRPTHGSFVRTAASPSAVKILGQSQHKLLDAIASVASRDKCYRCHCGCYPCRSSCCPCRINKPECNAGQFCQEHTRIKYDSGQVAAGGQADPLTFPARPPADLRAAGAGWRSAG